jgi:hypothetical protein
MQGGLETKFPNLKDVLLWPNGDRRQAVMLADQLRVSVIFVDGTVEN